MEDPRPSIIEQIPPDDGEKTPASVKKMVELMAQRIDLLEQQAQELLSAQQQLLEAHQQLSNQLPYDHSINLHPAQSRKVLATDGLVVYPTTSVLD
jgi:hypothetical protein